jgi:phosphatidylinositol-3-phosphatase
LLSAQRPALAVAWLVTPGVGSASTVNSAIPRYQHIIEIMMENTSYSTIIGEPLAPQINALADKYGLAIDYFGVTHPSSELLGQYQQQLHPHPGR